MLDIVPLPTNPYLKTSHIAQITVPLPCCLLVWCAPEGPAGQLAMPQHGPAQPQPGIGQAPMSRSPSIRRCRGMFHVLGGPWGVGIATGARLRRSAPHSPLPSAGPYPECTEAPHTAHLCHSPQVRAPRAGRGGWGGWYISPMALNGHPTPPGRAVPVL